ncbi:amylo-alpha-1,6-glucosidase [Nocardia puris]|uniref:Glycogen debranching enzyme n=1 Tax=Nocardia puris TaxID=208602 RepID=A0A366DHH0_9NOCA|nr:glycogen debranching N-terminal domain-containing protein [Nocardia puris]MBF6213344.1 amylo-alpha-1,6-glucosidase [Nocardia puris]MBF6369488.1 amylo-alpha-1,6-glucosidase [Nocardia puris]MBF6462223.1 amylo-alpha-1,6-glucosidase [Nocardia puris]RBO89530.1 glycogen debranching enzyme [Nocardia puris]
MSAPSVMLVEGSTFCLSRGGGTIAADRAEGLFVRDTRVLSGWRLTVNGHAPQPLGVRPAEPFSATLLLRTPPPEGRADSAALVTVARHVGDGMREDLTVRNLAGTAFDCVLALEVDADFADLFAVKDGRDAACATEIRCGEGALDIAAAPGLAVTVRAAGATAVGRALRWRLRLPPRGTWTGCVQYLPHLGDEEITPGHPCGVAVADSAPARRLRDWYASAPVVGTADHTLSAVLHRTLADLGALRLADGDRTAVAAGAPWYMALFGRDSLLTSWMSLPLDTAPALGTLRTLADLQGTRADPVTEEQPGRIPHEVRVGRAAARLPGGAPVYYGTADATPLFVMLLGELNRWGLDPADRDALLPHADRAIDWIERYGDADGDGFVEYRRTGDTGLGNQGWKDSWDGVTFADGSLPEAPIALAEVQGYAYAAYLARAALADDTGDTATATRLRAAAARLKEAFDAAFWLPDRGWYALGLDRDKRPIDALTSNIGHCLWTGIADEDKAALVADRLLAPDMFSGWGIRTLSAEMGAYNPVSYHNGSVWPHDNALCAAGLARYGFTAHAARVAEAVLDAAAHFDHRLPELFCGFDRSEFDAPVPYPTSCSPQAWAAAAPLLFLRALLRLEPEADGVRVAPAVPDRYLPLRIRGVRVGAGTVHVTVDERGTRVRGTADGVRRAG